MRLSLLALALAGCATLSAAFDSDTGLGSSAGDDAAGVWAGTCAGYVGAAPIALNLTLDLAESGGALSGTAEVDAAIGTTGTGTSVVATVDGQRQGNAVNLDASSSTATGPTWAEFSFDLLLSGDSLEGDLILPSASDATHVPCALDR